MLCLLNFQSMSARFPDLLTACFRKGSNIQQSFEKLQYEESIASAPPDLLVIPYPATVLVQQALPGWAFSNLQVSLYPARVFRKEGNWDVIEVNWLNILKLHGVCRIVHMSTVTVQSGNATVWKKSNLEGIPCMYIHTCCVVLMQANTCDNVIACNCLQGLHTSTLLAPLTHMVLWVPTGAFHPTCTTLEPAQQNAMCPGYS
jgi:hypothetical protein